MFFNTRQVKGVLIAGLICGEKAYTDNVLRGYWTEIEQLKLNLQREARFHF